ncbi:hypothetical protein BX666DRAFT_1856830, partial [Dichotomocladium elegans]
LLSLSIVFAQEDAQDIPSTANLEVTAQFPDNPFGLITNGQRNNVLMTVTNKEKADFTVLAISGKVSLPENPDKILRNLTALRYNAAVPADGSVDVPFTFYSEFAPGDLALTIFLDVLTEEKILRVVGYDGIITVVDPEISWFDPQLIFLYIVLGAIGLGVSYIIRKAFFGGSKLKAKKAKEPAAQPSHRDEKGQMILDESWIPEQYLKQAGSPKESPRVKKRASRK